MSSPDDDYSAEMYALALLDPCGCGEGWSCYTGDRLTGNEEREDALNPNNKYTWYEKSMSNEAGVVGQFEDAPLSFETRSSDRP